MKNIKKIFILSIITFLFYIIVLILLTKYTGLFSVQRSTYTPKCGTLEWKEVFNYMSDIILVSFIGSLFSSIIIYYSWKNIK